MAENPTPNRTAGGLRLNEAREASGPWRKWGPYLSERHLDLLYGAPAPDIRKEWSRLHQMLTSRFIDAGDLPDGFDWPVAPAKT